MKIRKMSISVIVMILCMVFMVACGNNSNVGEQVNNSVSASGENSAVAETTPEPEITPEPEEGLTGKTYDAGVFLMTKQNVKLLGRTWLNNDIRWLSFSASGVEFAFNGRSCAFSLRADSMYADKNHQVRYAIYVDDELVIDEMMDKGIKEVQVFTSDVAEEHVIRFVKLSETSDSSLGIQYITCDAEATIEPTEEKELKIEFVGDSITCGYGVDGVLGDSYMTSNEDATKAYAYLTAQKLGADYSIVSQSGYGIISGYTTSGQKQEKQAFPQYYDKVGNSYGTAGGINPAEKEWDFSFQPDVVVINLGTNDNSYTGSDAAKKEEYVQGYLAFLETVREKNPEAEIICALGVMGQELCPQVEDVVERFSTEKDDDKVHFVKLDVQAYANGFAVDYHPTAASHEHAAEQMAEAIQGILE
ncbi:MAG: GDSL family lipase [Lachnospiraceae bacterium]|nr:GDSL family lipase [Lachnospiraceae bacterium]